MSAYRTREFRDLVARIAANARRLRNARKWSQEQAAEACDLPLRTYAGLEIGESNVTLVTLARLLRGYRVRPGELLRAPRTK